MQITNGKVSYTRAVKPADYEKKEATVELSFLIAEGEDAATVVTSVGALAQEKALAMVNLKPAQNLTATEVAERSGKEAAAKAMNDAEPVKPKPGRPPKPAAVTETPQQKIAREMAAANVEPAKDSAAVEDAAEVTGDDALLGTESKPEITDQVMMSSITRKNQALQKPHGAEGAKLIRALIAKFAGPVPKQSRDIPQAVRQQFLNELEALS